jgi:hypothetical protein
VYFLAHLIWTKLSFLGRSTVVVLSLYPIVEGFAQGGIMASAAALLYFYFCHRIFASSRRDNTQLKRWRLLMLVVLSGGALLIASSIFMERIQFMYRDAAAYMSVSETLGTIRYGDSAYLLVDRYGPFAFVPIWLVHYFTLGVHEFFYLVDNYKADHFLGQIQLYVPIKFLTALGLFNGVTLADFADANPVPGHYQTFWGPAYMDFGPLIFIEALLLGLLCGWLHDRCRRASIWGLVLYPYAQVNIVIAFLANGFMGERIYFLVSLIALTLFCSWSLKEMRRRGTRHSIHESIAPRSPAHSLSETSQGAA